LSLCSAPSPLQQHVRLFFFVVPAIGELHLREALPTIEGARPRVALEGPEPNVDAPLQRALEQGPADPFAVSLMDDVEMVDPAAARCTEADEPSPVIGDPERSPIEGGAEEGAILLRRMGIEKGPLALGGPAKEQRDGVALVGASPADKDAHRWFNWARTAASPSLVMR